MKNLLVLIAMCVALNGFSQGIQVFVKGNSKPEGAGTLSDPFGTIGQAINEAIRLKRIQGHFTDTAFIWLKGGSYPVTESLVFDYKISGLPGAPLVISALPGEKVYLRGGREVPADLFKPVTDKSVLKRLVPEAKNHVWVADLKKAGMTQFDKIQSQGLNVSGKAASMELVCNDTLMQLARWPNTGYDKYGKVVDEGSIPRYRGMTLAPGAVPVDPLNPPPQFAKYINDTTNRPGSLLYINDRPLRWTQANDLWLFGWWRHPWASQTLKVKYIDTKKKEIGFEQPHHYGLGDNGLYYAFNLLEEIDMPGEYFIDRENGLLYFWPTSPISHTKTIISLTEKPLFYFSNASNVILRDITLEITRGNGIEIEGGNHITIESCVVRNIGLSGVVVKDGIAECHNHQVINTEFYCIRSHALSLGGGNRPKLIPAGNKAINNHFHHEARIQIQGVGNVFAHNLVHDFPNNALNWGGNDHLIEYNEFYNCLSDGDDASVMYTGRNPSGQGTIIRYNYLHHNGGRADIRTGSAGIYLDDGTTGQIIYGNIIYKTGKAGGAKFGAVFLHGAKDNLIVNNIFIECPIAIGFGPWPQDRWEKFLVSGDMKKALYSDVNINDSLFYQKYPTLQRLKENASVNRVHHNFSVQCDEFLSFPKGRTVEQITSGNWETTDKSSFSDYDKSDFTLKKGAEVFKYIPDFKQIPFDKIGLAKSPLEGKKVVTIGNSITAACGYQPFLVEWLGVNWSREETRSGVEGHAPMAVGGTMVRPTTAKSIFCRSFDAKYYQPDIILVYGSQNDNDMNKWGQMGDTPWLQNQVNDSVSLASAFMGMVEGLMRDNPKAKIYLITLMRVKATVGMDPVKNYETRYKHPRFSTFQEVLDWEKTARYPKVEMVRQIGKKYNLPVIDLYENSGVTNENADQFYGQIADDCTQVHPNESGYRRMAACIASVLDPAFKVPESGK